MALLAAAQEIGPGMFASTARHMALGKMAEAGRWVGGKEAAIDRDLIRVGTESTEAGKILDLNFHFKFVRQISGLEPYAPHLRSLDLSYNNLRQIEGLQGMARLRELKLYGCQIARISGLEPCACLMSLHLDDNNITAVEGLDALKNLEFLNLDSNRIQRLGRGIAKLAKLKEFHVSRNRLASLDGIAGLSSLEVLHASFNQIRGITPEQVKGLSKLDELRLEGNQLTSLSFLVGVSGSAQPLPWLATLDVSGNQITAEALQSLPCLHQLAELNLAANRISEVPGSVMQSWQSLEILDLSRNHLERPEQLDPLKELISLRELALQGNPVAAQGEEDLKGVFTALDALEYLDDRPVPPSQPATPALVGADTAEEGKTFALTNSKAGADAAAGGSRPSTSSRPGTSSSRPGTAQGMKEAGIKEPLMHARLKVSERRYANEEQVAQWEKQTMTGLAAIERQMEKTDQIMDKEFAVMDRCVQKAHQVMERRRQLQAQGVLPPLPEAGSNEETLVVEEASRLSTPNPASEPRSGPPSRLGRRLREAVDSAREEEEDEFSPGLRVGTSGSSSSSQAPTPESPTRRENPRILPAAYDEEILEEPSASRPGSGCPTDAEEDDEPPQVLTEAEEEPDTPAAVPRRSRLQAGRTPSQNDLHVGIRTGARRMRRTNAGPTGARGKPPLARMPAR